MGSQFDSQLTSDEFKATRATVAKHTIAGSIGTISISSCSSIRRSSSSSRRTIQRRSTGAAKRASVAGTSATALQVAEQSVSIRKHDVGAGQRLSARQPCVWAEQEQISCGACAIRQLMREQREAQECSYVGWFFGGGTMLFENNFFFFLVFFSAQGSNVAFVACVQAWWLRMSPFRSAPHISIQLMRLSSVDTCVISRRRQCEIVAICASCASPCRCGT
jgi:hypothetical protein